VTGPTSNPPIFEQVIKNSTAYDVPILESLRNRESDEALFFELALEDITQAADLFRPTYVDGGVSLEVSPLLAHNTSTAEEPRLCEIKTYLEEDR
jgi:transaldolase